MEAVAASRVDFMTKVYGWMTIGFLITAVIAMKVASSMIMVEYIFGNKFLFAGLIIFELLCVIVLASRIEKLSPLAAIIIFFVYAAFNGMLFSIIFLSYTKESITSTFFITSATFGGASLYGFIGKRDLHSIGGYLMMALWGLIIAMLVNLFIGSAPMAYLISMVVVVVFVLLTAYDTQKIRKMMFEEGSDMETKAAIMGALTLYLDFINLYLHLLRLVGVNVDGD